MAQGNPVSYVSCSLVRPQGMFPQQFRYFILLGYLISLTARAQSQGTGDPCSEYGHVLYDYFCDPCDVTQQRFYVCLADGTGSLQATENQCGVGTKCRNQGSSHVICDWPYNVHWTVEEECDVTGVVDPAQICAFYGHVLNERFCDPCDDDQESFFVCLAYVTGSLQATRQFCAVGTKCRNVGSNNVICDWPYNVHWTVAEECGHSGGGVDSTTTTHPSTPMSNASTPMSNASTPMSNTPAPMSSLSTPMANPPTTPHAPTPMPRNSTLTPQASTPTPYVSTPMPSLTHISDTAATTTTSSYTGTDPAQICAFYGHVLNERFCDPCDDDQESFYVCLADGTGSLQATRQFCGVGTKCRNVGRSSVICDWPYNVHWTVAEECGHSGGGVESTTTTLRSTLMFNPSSPMANPSTPIPHASTPTPHGSTPIPSLTHISDTAGTPTASSDTGTGAGMFVCYFTNWAMYRASPWRQTAADIDPHLCTHIVYAFGTLTGTTVSESDYNDLAFQYEDMMAHKQVNPNLKVLLSVGGWNAGTAGFSAIASSASSRQQFINSAMTFCRQYDFDGFDIDWEYPNKYNAAPQDYVNYPILIREFRQAFEVEAAQTGRERLLLAAAFGVGPTTIQNSYDISAFHEYFDFMSLMTYDFRGSWDGVLGLHADLYPESDTADDKLNGKAAVEAFLDRGAPAEKLVLGIPIYGRTYSLCSPTQTRPGDASCGPGPAGQYTVENGYMAYFEICQAMQSQGPWTTVWNDVTRSVYSYSSTMWISYDNVAAIQHKMAFINARGLGGAMIWDLSLDDFRNECGGGIYPLANEIRASLASANSRATSTLPTPSSNPISSSSVEENSPVNSTPDGSTRTHSTQQHNAPTDKMFVCYFTNWAMYRASPWQQPAADIDPHLCTHIVYAFAALSGNTVVYSDYNDIASQYTDIMAHKLVNPNLKVLLSVGGWNAGTAAFSAIASSASSRQQFINSAVTFCRQYDFDGFDIDWEYPNKYNAAPQDYVNYPVLIQEFREAFELEASQSGRQRLLLAAAFGVGPTTIQQSYDIAAFHQYFDFMSLMTYDFHGSWDGVLGLHADLYPDSVPQNEGLNAQAAVETFLQADVPADKLVLGIPLYGRTFTLCFPSQTTPGQASCGAGPAGQFTSEGGFMAYYEICQELQSDAWTTVWKSDTKSVYSYNSQLWISYDNLQAIQHKVDFINSRGLGGAMIWDLSLDDFNGVCGEGVYPLANAIKAGLALTDRPSTLSMTPSPAVSLTSRVGSLPGVQSTVTASSASIIIDPPRACQHYGHVIYDYFCDPCDVQQRRYYVCMDAGDGSVVALSNHCGDGTRCRDIGVHTIACDWPENVDWSVADACGSTVPGTSMNSFGSRSTPTVPVSSRSTHNDQSSVTQPAPISGGGKLVCYFTNWAMYRASPWRQTAADIDPHLCTHIVYAFATLSGNTVVYSDYNDIASQYSDMMAHKLTNPDLKVLVSVGGWNAGTAGFSAIASSASNRQQFINSAMTFCRQYDFDGFDIDWEYPNKYNAAPQDYINYPVLIQEFRQAFEREAAESGRERLLLAAAFGVGPTTIENSYDIGAFHQYFDFMSLMTYDFHGPWDGQLGLHADLYPETEAGDDFLNARAAVETFLARGAPRDKLVLGIPIYGKTYTLCSPAQTTPGQASCGAGPAGQFTGESGFMAYFEICQAVSSADVWTTVWNDNTKSVYSYSNNMWISYDNVQAIQHKMEFVREYGLGGAMIWDLSLDDFNNVCGEGVYPLVNAILSGFTHTNPSPDTTTSPHITTSPRITTPPSTTTVIVDTHTQSSSTVTSQSRSTSTPTTTSVPLPKKLVCYYSNLSQYHAGRWSFDARDVKAGWCTHLVFGMASLRDDYTVNLTEQNDAEMIATLMELKVQNNDLKILLAVGGNSTDPEIFRSMARRSGRRSTFTQSVLDIIEELGFDGLDLVWKFPLESDQQRFTSILEDLREAFDAFTPPLLLSAMLGADPDSMAAFDVPSIVMHVDWLSLHTFDYVDSSIATRIGLHSALYCATDASDPTLCADWTVREFVSRGAPPEKLLLGVSLHGVGGQLKKKRKNDIGDKSLGVSDAAKYTNTPGFFSYYEICLLLKKTAWNKRYVTDQMGVLAYNKDTWIAYDDATTIGYKVDYIHTMNLGGAAIPDISLDDFRGKCDDGKVPLIKTLKNGFD